MNHPHDLTARFPKRPRSDREICATCGLSQSRLHTQRGDICKYCQRAWRSLAEEKRRTHGR